MAPALFHRAGGGAAAVDDFERVAQLFDDVTDPGIVMHVAAVIAHLHEQGFDDESIGIVGFCWGGPVSFLISLRSVLGAAVGFYGGGIVGRPDVMVRRRPQIGVGPASRSTTSSDARSASSWSRSYWKV